MKDKQKTPQKVGILLFMISLLLVAWLLWPYSRTTREISFKPGDITFELENGPNQAATELSFPDGLHLVLEWNPVIRKGSTETIHFQVLPDGSLPEGSNSNNLDGYSFMLKSRLDMSDVIMDPSGESGVVYSQGNSSSFSWKVTPLESGDLQGTTWFFLVVFPGNGDIATEKAVSAQNFDIKVISILGINTIFLWGIVIIFASMGFLLFKGYVPTKKRKGDLGKQNIKQPLK